jgi:hexosaminidase
VAELPVIPAPLRAEWRDGGPFVLRPGSRVLVSFEPAAVTAAVLVATRIGAELGVPVAVTHDDDGSPGAVELRLTTDPSELPVPFGLAPVLAVEAYRLEIDTRRVTVTALDAAGLMRGLSTLEQLARPTGQSAVAFPPLLVVDYPRFAWRGLCLDLARHFFDTDTIKQVISVMGSLKLNMLHLHLTDDQGWRLHCPSRPALTELSGETAVGGDPGGFLTVADYADLIRYAAARGIAVVPEIDIPGHVNAALHAYGELTPGGEAVPAYTGAGVGFSRLHAELPATAAFIEAVLDDVASATPGPYLHIGGDEALTMHAAEYDQLVGIACSRARAADKVVVGWQEVARTSLPPGSIVQHWDDREANDHVLAAVAAGARVLLSPASRVYLDMRYDDATPIGQDWAGHISLRDAYAWEPADALPIPIEQVIGVEAAIWTETVRTPRELFLLLLPRLAAVAEVAWSIPERRSWEQFSHRVERLTPQWDAAGLPWYRPAANGSSAPTS